MLEGRSGGTFPRHSMPLKTLPVGHCRVQPCSAQETSGTGKRTSCRVFLHPSLLKYVFCIARYPLAAWYKEILSSYGTRHHALPFSNRYAHWLTFGKDPGFHPKLNEVKGNFFLLTELWISSLHFSVQSCNPLTFLLWLLAKLFNSFPYKV